MKDMHRDITELLARRATEGLDDEQARQLEDLLSAHGQEDTQGFDLAAAAAANAFGLEQAQDPSRVSPELTAKLVDDAERFLRERQANVVELRPQPSRYGNWGWATAAALALLLIGNLFVDFETSTDLAAQRERLIAQGTSTTVIPWAQPEDPAYAQVTGDVAWNDERQEGYMLLTGMPANDPASSQYQLWLVDPERDSNPVDGGVFDIPAGASSVVIPIDAKLAVSNPRIFAITREQPGGVVVSKGPLLVVATMPQST